jgi:cyclopropane-fatty-acyl-phospholipid synthase
VKPARTIGTLALRRLRGGRVEVVENGERTSFGPPDADLRITIEVHDPSFWGGALRGSLGLAETYLAGAWDCDDLTTLARIAARDLPRLDSARRAILPLRRLVERLPRNTIEGSRRHISAHYDLGNELFASFLDPTMTYSCASYDSPQASLAEAQEAKLDRICRKLELGAGDHLLEIGSGWGSLAIHAASNYGCRVTTTTISRRQHALAAQRVAEAGVDDRVTVLLEDYRELRGRFDKLVSVEMIEAVGWQYFELFFRRCAELLREGGLMLLQAITIDEPLYELEKDTRTFTTTYVFPSGCLPSLEVIRRSASGAGLAEVGLEDMTDSYPLTLRAWRRNFIAARERIAALGYDRRFHRLWELYLSWSEGGFLERRIQDYQQLLVAPGVGEPHPGSQKLSLAARG